VVSSNNSVRANKANNNSMLQDFITKSQKQGEVASDEKRDNASNAQVNRALCIFVTWLLLTTSTTKPLKSREVVSCQNGVHAHNVHNNSGLMVFATKQSLTTSQKAAGNNDWCCEAAYYMRQKPLAHRLEDHQAIVGAAIRITERSLEC
jgi:hypothetical protein